MITIEQYDITQPSMRKAWKAEFHEFLIEYYRPSLINAENVFKAIPNVDNFIKKHNLGDKMLHVKDVSIAKNVKRFLLSHKSFAMGGTVSANDYKVIVLERYIEFLSDSNRHNTTIVKPHGRKVSDDELLEATEGMMKEVAFFRRQRNRAIRNQCAARDNYTCQVCGFSFEKTYGERGKGYIEVHHLKPLFSYDDEHDIELHDLISLCSNCHSMIHMGGEIKTPNELVQIIKEKLDKTSK